METLIQDVRYALRTLRNAPGFTAVAILSLGLGIGANTAIFSVVDALMLKQLPVVNPERLVLFGEARAGGIFDGVPESVQLVAPAALAEIRKEKRVFEDASGVFSIPLTLHPLVAGAQTSERLSTSLVTGNYFSMLGVNASAGRMFTDDVDEPRNTHAEVVISQAYWKRRFGGRADAVGAKMLIGERVFTIVGVAAPEFFGTTVGEAADAWIPFSMVEVVPPYFKFEGNMDQQLYAIARLRPGVSIEQATAAETVLMRRLYHAFAGSTTLTARDRQTIDRMRVTLTPAGAGLSNLRRNYSLPLQVLMVVVGIVLLIACANVANLLLARATARQRELAVRFAVGSGRWRIVRQLLTESLLLSMAGGVAGIVLAMWGTQILIKLVTDGTDNILMVNPDLRLLGFTFGISLLTGILFGVAPALRASSVDPNTGLREGRSGTATRGRMFAGRALVVSQVALSLLLLIGAGLFVRSFRNLEHIDTGFNRASVLLFGLDSDATGMKEDERLSRFYEKVEGRVAAIPGVESVSFAMFAFHQGQWTMDVFAEGHPEVAAAQKDMWFNAVGNDYLGTLGIPLLAGRFFNQHDTNTSQKVVVINETAAKAIFGNESPIGRHIGVDTKTGLDTEIIGLVKDAKYQGLREKTPWMAYVPFAQKNGFMGNLLVKTSQSQQAAVIREVRRAIGELDRNLPISSVKTMDDLVTGSIRTQHLIAELSAFFGGLALLLAAIGLYGVLSYSVARRTNEIGVRMALGAQGSGVLWMILRETLSMVGWGVLIGLPAALLCAHSIETLLYGLKAIDAVSIVCAVAVLAAIGSFAGFLPARRAAHVDPMVALRYE